MGALQSNLHRISNDFHHGWQSYLQHLKMRQAKQLHCYVSQKGPRLPLRQSGMNPWEVNTNAKTQGEFYQCLSKG